jgi:hypothetical protein
MFSIKEKLIFWESLTNRFSENHSERAEQQTQ